MRWLLMLILTTFNGAAMYAQEVRPVSPGGRPNDKRLSMEAYRALAAKAQPSGYTGDIDAVYVPEVLWKDWMAEPPCSSYETAKLDVLLNYTWGLAYVCKHDLESFKKAGADDPRHLLLLYFGPKGCSMCYGGNEDVVAYILTLAKKPADELNHMTCSGWLLMSDVITFLWDMYSCEPVDRYFDGLMDAMQNSLKADDDTACLLLGHFENVLSNRQHDGKLRLSAMHQARAKKICRRLLKNCQRPKEEVKLKEILQDIHS
jgi:hypothetical protein